MRVGGTIAIMALLAPLAARAGFTSSDTIDSSWAGRTLYGNTVYRVTADTTLTGHNSGPALQVSNAGVTTVIYIPKGITLTVNGGDANGSTGADAGIRVPSGTTLIVTGGGKLVATGGNAANGGNGGSGSNGHQYYDDGTPGRGGNGGAGGGGAGPGIGGSGGSGGSGGTQSTSPVKRTTTWGEYDYNGADGGNGGNGGNGGSAGTLYALGTVSLTAQGGGSGSGGSQGASGSGEYADYSRSWRVGGGGYGGGGAGGAAAPYGIGGGGYGGGGGGAGGNGGSYETTPSAYTYYMPNGGNGGGGSNNGGGSRSNGQYTSYTGNDPAGKRGGNGGSGGSAGSNGASGNLYCDSGVAISSTYAAAMDADSHPAIEYKLRFSDSQRVNTNMTVRLGYALPTAPIPHARPGWRFDGWFTEDHGGGVKYYNADGSLALALDEYANVGDLTLYAAWTLVDAHLADTISINGVGLVGGVSQDGDGWNYDGHAGYVRLYESGKTYVVTGKDNDGEFCIWPNKACTVVMSNLTINASANVDRPPFEVMEGESPTLLFKGENFLYGPADHPAIHVYRNSTLTIGACDGSVRATGGANAPGIGGMVGQTSGTLNIEGGTIEAIGGTNGSGIGAAVGSGFGTVTISGGTITATGQTNGAGIGGSSGAGMGTCIIAGGTVTATGGAYASGIGSGANAIGGTVKISGGTVNATSLSFGAGIGGGQNSTGLSVTIDGGDVTATGGYRAAGIGGGRDGRGVTVKITGGDVTATGGNYGAGIGAGDASDQGTASGNTVEISGGRITATGRTAAGIGAGDYMGCGAITITGGTVNATGEGSASAIGKSGHSAATAVSIQGGAVYPDLADISPAPSNTASKSVFPVDFEIGEKEGKVTSLALYGTLSSYTYGSKDLYTDTSGKLRVWLPATDGKGFVAKVVMESGKECFFSYLIGDDGELTEAGYLVVDGSVVSSDDDYAGTGWSYTKSTCVLELTASVYVQGLSTNGEFRIVVPSTSLATDIEFRNLTLKTLADGSSSVDVSAVDFERDVTLTLTGTNVISAAGKYSAGIEVASAAALTIKGDGALSASGGQNAAGIGTRGGNASPGRIVIESGAIVAQGGEKGAGIGGGVSSNLTADNIVITGGYVTATGGSMAAGIGSGYVRTAIPDGAVKISGGTVLATKGSGAGNVGDFIMSGNANSVTGEGSDKSLCITGGSVHGTNLDAKPTPVDDDGTPLRYLLFANLAVGAEVSIVSSDIPATYGMNDIVADATGSICLWLPMTNLVRVVSVNEMYFSVDGSTNSVFDAASGSAEPADSRREGPVTMWRVTLPQLAAGATAAISGLEPHASAAMANAAGDAFVFLPDGEHDFSVDGKPWAVSVSGAPAVAHRVTGVSVNGEDAGFLHGEGWAYDVTNGVLSLSGAVPYVLYGTNTQGTVRIRVEADAAVTLSNLCLKATANRRTPFAVASNVTARVWFTGTNTLEAGRCCAALEVPGVSDLEIGGDGWLHAKGGATSDYWGCPAIGISDGMYYEFQHRTVTITGGNFVASSGALGTVSGIDDPVVFGGNIFIGRHPDYDHYVLANSGATTPQGESAACVEVPDLEPNAPVVLRGLPDWYNASNICADAEGKVYLYLQVTYTDETTYFTANGQSYKVVVLHSGAANTAEKVTCVPPTALRIESIAVAEDEVKLVVSAEPDGWLTAETALFLRVRAAAALPLPEGEEALLPQADVAISVNADGTATATAPRAAETTRMFYSVEAP